MKRFVFGNTVTSPDDDPFNGAPKNPQSIALRKERNISGIKRGLVMFLTTEEPHLRKKC